MKKVLLIPFLLFLCGFVIPVRGCSRAIKKPPKISYKPKLRPTNRKISKPNVKEQKKSKEGLKNTAKNISIDTTKNGVQKSIESLTQKDKRENQYTDKDGIERIEW